MLLGLTRSIERMGFPPLRQKKGAKTGHGASMPGDGLRTCRGQSFVNLREFFRGERQI
jgi:hypothetical protein